MTEPNDYVTIFEVIHGRNFTDIDRYIFDGCTIGYAFSQQMADGTFKRIAPEEFFAAIPKEMISTNG